MSKQNLKRRCAILLSASFASTFVTNANENNTQIITNENTGGDSLNNGGFPTPSKIAFIVPLALPAAAGIKAGTDFVQYKIALNKAKQYVSSTKKSNDILASRINRLENSGLTWKLKTYLLNFVHKPKCQNLMPFLQNQCEDQKISWLDQQMNFGFLKKAEFITACEKYSEQQTNDPLINACLQFVRAYLYNQISLLSNPPKSYGDIPNWKLIEKIISGMLKPMGVPIQAGKTLTFNFVIEKGNQKGEIIVLTLTRK